MNQINWIYKYLLLLFIFSISFGEGMASDTITLSLQQIEKKFLEKNYFILASKYNVESEKALIIQQRLLNNPTFSYEQNIYNPSNGKYFDASSNGQFIVQVDKLFLLAGKRNKRINLAEINYQMAELEFQDLIRTLKFELRNNFYDLYFSQKSLAMYDEEIASIKKTVELYDMQYSRGNIALKEVVRLKAFLFGLENERKDLLLGINENHKVLHILMSDSSYYYINATVEKEVLDKLSLKDISLNNLLQEALNNRSDLKLQEKNIQYEKQNLALQKALAVPDIRAGALYDRAGSFVPNYYALSFQMDLPIFNRNQGAIKSADSRIKSTLSEYDYYLTKLESEVVVAYQKALESDKIYKESDEKFMKDFDRLIEGILSSYEKKNISLIEFIDFYESYKSNVVLMNKLQNERMVAIEEINFQTETNIINY